LKFFSVDFSLAGRFIERNILVENGRTIERNVWRTDFSPTGIRN